MTVALLKIASVVITLVPRRYLSFWPLRYKDDLLGPALVSGLLEFTFCSFGFLRHADTFDLVFMGDGAVRCLGALIARQVLPTFPLAIVAGIHGLLEDKKHVQRLGALVPDVVERGEGQAWDLRVLSCRAKTHWNSYNTIRFQGEFYQFCGQDLTTGERKFVYMLRKHPETRLIVVVYDYSPNDVLIPDIPPRRWTP